MMDISTPALLFPAVSLLLLAYTNRFLATAQLIRMLSHQEKKADVLNQISNLKWRLELTKWMQFFGVASLLLCTLSMAALFLEFGELGKKIFGISLVVMCASLLLSLWEVTISTKALNMELEAMDVTP
jgi:uncharacterized membrane protein